MKLTAISYTSDISEIDFLLLPLFRGQAITQEVPSSLQPDIKKFQARIEFEGQWGRSEVFPLVFEGKPLFVALLGLGGVSEPVEKQTEGLRRAVASALQDGRKHLLRTVGIFFPSDIEHTAALVEAAHEALVLSEYRFTDYQRKASQNQEARAITAATFSVSNQHLKKVRAVLKASAVTMRGVTLARTLVNQPASRMRPGTLVQEAKQIKKTSPRISLTVYNRSQAAKKGFTAFLEVARGSTEEPYVIHLVYKPKKKAKAKIALVGKGITFDSGGLSLKPAQPMENMKIDMGGAATVLGVMATLAELNAPVEVHGIVATCENMPSGNAYRPGDILTAMNGKTIEVLNTDAEGRITLADALCYAEKQKPDMIVDLATLTGACLVALGDTHAGLWSNNEKLQDELVQAARAAGEGVVALPLPAEYRTTIESKVADLRNIATMDRNGGAITAAMFLREFVEKTPWAHLDIAGPVFAERPLLPYYQYGGTGFGVRTLVRWISSLSLGATENVGQKRD